MCEHHHDHNHTEIKEKPWWIEQKNLLIALIILLTLLLLEYAFRIIIASYLKLIFSAVAYFLAGWPVIDLAVRKASRGDFFNEFVLMTIATIGAFLIGEYEEGVAVMVFYQIGEWFQDSAVDKAKRNIKALLDVRPEEVTVIRDGKELAVHPNQVAIDEIIRIKAGEKVALDGILSSDSASFNTAALTGESKPDTKYKNEEVLAGMINLEKVSLVQVRAAFKDSKLSRILEMVQDATARKSQTQLFISKFSKVYVPIVFGFAVAVCLLPAFFLDEYIFREWFYRSLVFLVISCPCALVVSIPLGYFGGIGLASRNGILFKGGNFLDAITTVDSIVMDKTGTLTKGVFEVREVKSAQDITPSELLRYAKAIESQSTHPIAKAVMRHDHNEEPVQPAEQVEEIAGHGLKGIVNGREVLAGNAKLLEKFGISYPAEIKSIVDSIVILAINQQYAGYITVADQIKDDAAEVIRKMKDSGLHTVMLSGDKSSVVNDVAQKLGIDEAYGNLLPEDKVKHVQALLDQNRKVAFAGDGVNDAPVVALATVGIAMGGLGADATVETADVVIQNDEPRKILAAIRIGKLTRNIVWQNIILALSVKIIVLILGAGGVATLWEAVIADVGVALAAILNAVRVQRMKV
ncbi:heavy metal translocating P-type ATPase [Sphingobacterium spiritivorum]|uniref:P-type Zn(2+) transporter n=1 Tax=Sphingobacterium spiritivorum ATCC 33861 TaxID=525373 RepID=D7VII4_SPHSI|nr:heavy metal translocating P-type ATPase [Sphingobacterium spiritivorum]EFK59886.1 cadmium-exporting ATPase [Sphingobacterium spiritivorum ATCC 33861]QQT37475.1 cadmium-translocating P-type ATPase [Sphingobacterium spiritivorum]WQD34270.1 heavy metal translocating P-type ATPase [Sphingobacterium spiritivorum]SUI97095.1 Zinc-transporting ATPase [Sphingobacterium spiritivorum]